MLRMQTIGIELKGNGNKLHFSNWDPVIIYIILSKISLIKNTYDSETELIFNPKILIAMIYSSSFQFHTLD